MARIVADHAGRDDDVLAAARTIYLDAGFRLVGEEPHHSFGADLVGQDYLLGL